MGGTHQDQQRQEMARRRVGWLMIFKVVRIEIESDQELLQEPGPIELGREPMVVVDRTSMESIQGFDQSLNPMGLSALDSLDHLNPSINLPVLLIATILASGSIPRS